MGAAEYEDRWSDRMAAWYEQLHPAYTYFEAAGRDVSVTDKVLCLLSEDTDPIEEYVVRAVSCRKGGVTCYDLKFENGSYLTNCGDTWVSETGSYPLLPNWAEDCLGSVVLAEYCVTVEYDELEQRGVGYCVEGEYLLAYGWDVDEFTFERAALAEVFGVTGEEAIGGAAVRGAAYECTKVGTLPGVWKREGGKVKKGLRGVVRGGVGEKGNEGVKGKGGAAGGGSA